LVWGRKIFLSGGGRSLWKLLRQKEKRKSFGGESLEQSIRNPSGNRRGEKRPLREEGKKTSSMRGKKREKGAPPGTPSPIIRGRGKGKIAYFKRGPEHLRRSLHRS